MAAPTVYRLLRLLTTTVSPGGRVVAVNGTDEATVVTAFDGPDGRLTILGLDTSGGTLDETSPTESSYDLTGLPADTTFRLHLWNAGGDGLNTLRGRLRSEPREPSLTAPLHTVFALTTPGRPRRAAQVNAFTARATMSPKSASATVDCTSMSIRPVRERHHVGRAERRRVREAEVQVVQKKGRAAGRRELRAHLLREREVDRERVPRARAWAAAVDEPVEEREGEVVAEPRRLRPMRAARWASSSRPLPSIRSLTRSAVAHRAAATGSPPA